VKKAGLHFLSYSYPEVICFVQNLNRDTKIWHPLNHENVLPFLGFSEEIPRWKLPALISPFCENGDLGKYLDGELPEIGDRALIVRILHLSTLSSNDFYRSSKLAKVLNISTPEE
jgi:hypothetical protein